jgi:hypothetical protein
MRAILGGRGASAVGIPLWVLAMAVGAPGCFAMVDVDRFHSAQAAATTPTTTATTTPDSSAPTGLPGEYLNLKFSLVGMKPHILQLFEYRIIDSHNFVQSRGVVNPLGGPDVTINVPLSVPKLNGPFHFDFYADVNHSGGYDGLGSVAANDHAWRIDPLEDFPAGAVAPVDGLIQVTFTHNTSFTDINTYPSGTPNPPHDTGLGATIHVANAGALQGVLIQVRIVDPSANHTVGLFRIPQIAQASFDMVIPGIVESGVDYAALVYVDANGNGKYDNPANGLGDLGWRVIGTAGATGLNVGVDAQTTQAANVDVGF